MQWTDHAILLGVKRTQDILTLEVLTEVHGRCHCALFLDGGELPALLPGSALGLTVTPGGLGSIGRATIQAVAGGVVPGDAEDVALLVLRAVKRLLGLLLPVSEPVRPIYQATGAVVRSLAGRDGRWPVHYAQWELAVLKTLGHCTEFERCRPAFRHGETIYLAPRSGRFVTRAESGAFLDRMLPVPRFLMSRADAGLADVRQALTLTGALLDKFALPTIGVEAPPERGAVVKAVDELEALPRADDCADPPPDEAAVRKRLLALRPLTL